jgi:hypothetical protein
MCEILGNGRTDIGADQALLWRAGPAGAILDAAIAYEGGSFGSISLQGHRRDVGGADRHALRWAQTTIAEIA